MTAARRSGGGHALLTPVAEESRHLDTRVRHDMEVALGASFGDVVIHVGGASGTVADELDASAFTVGRHVVFGPGRYDPGSVPGRQLLAHELAHVVEQRRGGGDPDAGERLPARALARHETHGDDHNHTAAQAALGRTAPVAGASGVGVARQSKQAEQHVPLPTVPMFQYTDETGQTRLVTLEEGEKLKAEALRRMRASLKSVMSTAEIWRETHKEHLDMGHAESFGDLWDKPSRIFGVAANMRAGVVPPTLGIWHHPIHVALEAQAALDKGDLREAARLLRLATTHLNSAKKDWNDFIEASIGGAEKLAGELEVVRDTSFAIAIAAGAIVAAPVVAGGVAAMGVTGAGATALTAAGTGLVTMTGGAVLRGTSDVAAQKVVNGKVDFEKTKKYVRSHLKEDLATGLTAGLAPGAGTAAGLGKQGLTVGQHVVRNVAVQSGISAGTGVVTTGADTALALAEGKSWEKSKEENLLPGLKNTAVNTVSSAVTAPLGSVGQSLAKGSRPAVGKVVEHGGGAVVAGGSTLAMGGTWEEARTQAFNSLVTSVALGKAQQGSDKAAAAKQQKQAGAKPPVQGPPAPPSEHETPAVTAKPTVDEPLPSAKPVVEEPVGPTQQAVPTADEKAAVGPKKETASSTSSPVVKGPAEAPTPAKLPGEVEPTKPATHPDKQPSGSGTATAPKSRPARSGKSKAGVKGTPAKPVQTPDVVEPGGPGDQTPAPPKKATPAKKPARGKKTTPPAVGAGPRDQNGLPPGWDYQKNPTGPSRRWRIGDPVNMPDSKGRHPRWDTVRKRIWKTKAADELAKKEAGTSKAADRLLPLDPIEELTPKQLEKVQKTGKMPKKVGAEVEHARIPQRVGRMLEDVGVPRSKAAEVTKLGDPTNLEPTNKEWHAVVDEKAREINPNRNKSLPVSLDDRAAHPLGSASNAEIAKIVETLKQPGVNLDTPAGVNLRTILAAEKQRRGASATWEVP